MILHMDDIATDNTGRLNLTPLNITLGIFNIKIKLKLEVLLTIYYHPDNETENLYHSHKPTPFESLQNLHASIEAAMESFYQVTQEGDLGLVSLWREEVESEKNLQ